MQTATISGSDAKKVTPIIFSAVCKSQKKARDIPRAAG
jgi:hypothetical protein